MFQEDAKRARTDDQPPPPPAAALPPAPRAHKNLFSDAIESTRISPAGKDDVPFRPYPSTFGKAYVLPAHREKKLSTANGIPFFDDHIEFYEEPHLYKCFGRVSTKSVSSMAKPYKEQFDRAKVIPRMMKSHRFPKLRYAVNPSRLTEEAFLALDASTIVIIHNAAIDEHVYTGPVYSAPPLCSANEEVYTFDRPFTYEEISDAWDDPTGKHMGTEGHLAMEDFFNGESVWVSEELLTGLHFVETVMAPLRIAAYRTELVVYAPEEDVAGAVDFLAKTKGEETYHIFDWKRAKEGKLTPIFPKTFSKRLLFPFEHIVDSDVGVYTFQLSLYKYIIEKYTTKKVASLALVSIYPGITWHTFCPYFEYEVEYLMRKRRELVAARITAAILAPGLPKCEISGEIAHSAVRTACGSRVFNEASWILAKNDLPPATVDWETRNAVERVVSNVAPWEQSVEEANLLKHRRRFEEVMPKEGVQAFKRCEDF